MDYLGLFLRITSFSACLRMVLLILLTGFALPSMGGWVKTFSAGENAQLTPTMLSNQTDLPILELTADGGYILSGPYTSYTTGQEEVGQSVWLVKLNSAGVLQWQRRYLPQGATQRSTYLRALHQTQDNGYILAGYTYVAGRGTEGWLIKLDTNGDIQWTKNYGGALSEGVNDIVQTDDSGYLAIGWSDTFSESMQSIGPGQYELVHLSDAWVFKLDSQGNTLWQKTYGGGEHEVGSNADFNNYAVKILKVASDGYIIKFSHHFVKLSTNGDVLWRERPRFSVDNNKSFGMYDIKSTSDNGYITVGTIYERIPEGPVGHDNIEHLAIIKLNASFDLEWYKVYGDATITRNILRTYTVRETVDRGYILAGFSSYNQWHGLILKFTATGQLEWQRGYGDTSRVMLNDIRVLKNGEIVTLGNKYGENYGLILARLNSNGTLSRIPFCRFVRNGQLQERTFPISVSLGNSYPTYYIEQIPATSITSNTVSQQINIQSQSRCGISRLSFQCCLELSQLDALNRKNCRFDQYDRLCNKLPCLNCYLSGRTSTAQYQEISDTLSKRIISVQEELSAGDFNKNAMQSLQKVLLKIPSSRFYDAKLKSEVLATIDEVKISKKAYRKLASQLANTMNAIELDFRVPKLEPVKVTPNNKKNIDLQGMARFSFEKLTKKGDLKLEVVRGLPVSVENTKPGWPALTYNFKFTGKRTKGSMVNIELFIGQTHNNSIEKNLRVLQWDGKDTVSDITSGYDPKSKVIDARTNHLSNIFVVENVKLKQGERGSGDSDRPKHESAWPYPVRIFLWVILIVFVAMIVLLFLRKRFRYNS